MEMLRRFLRFLLKVLGQKDPVYKTTNLIQMPNDWLMAERIDDSTDTDVLVVRFSGSALRELAVWGSANGNSPTDEIRRIISIYGLMYKKWKKGGRTLILDKETFALTFGDGVWTVKFGK